MCTEFDGIFLDLEPIAVVHRQNDDIAMAIGADEHVPPREERRSRGVRSEIGEQQPAQFAHRIGTDPHGLRRLARLERPVDALALAVELPAVVAAADAVLLDEPEVQRGPAVGAMLLDAKYLAGLAAIDQQILAQQADALLGVFCSDLLGRAKRLPVAPQKLAAGRAGAHARQALVLFLGQHRSILSPRRRAAQPAWSS